MDTNNNNYTSAKIDSYLDMLKNIARVTSSLKEASDKAKLVCGRSYAEFSKKVDNDIKSRAEAKSEKKTNHAADDAVDVLIKSAVKLLNTEQVKRDEKSMKCKSNSVKHADTKHADPTMFKEQLRDMTEFIHEIIVNRRDREIKIRFNDGRTTCARCHPCDDFDLVTGVALCFSRWVFGEDFSQHVEKFLGI